MNATLVMCDKEKRMKEEALKLADELEDCAKYGECDWVYPKIPAGMIRKLVAELNSAEDTIGRLMLEINRLHNEKI